MAGADFGYRSRLFRMVHIFTFFSHQSLISLTKNKTSIASHRIDFSMMMMMKGRKIQFTTNNEIPYINLIHDEDARFHAKM